MPATPRPPAADKTPTELSARLAEVTSERDSYKRLYLDMLAVCRKLELGIVGRGRERDLGDPNQVAMSLLGMLTGLEAERPAPAAVEKVREHERAKPTGRQPLPEQLPRVEVTVLPPEVEQRGLEAFERIGEDVTETVERRPASLVVVRVTKPKFVAKDLVYFAGEACTKPIWNGSMAGAYHSACMASKALVNGLAQEDGTEASRIRSAQG